MNQQLGSREIQLLQMLQQNEKSTQMIIYALYDMCSLFLYQRRLELSEQRHTKLHSSFDSDRKLSGDSPFMNNEPIFTNYSWWYYNW